MRPIWLWLAFLCTLAVASAFALPAAAPAVILPSLHVLERKMRLQTSGFSHGFFTFTPSIERGATDISYGASRAMVRLSYNIGLFPTLCRPITDKVRGLCRRLQDTYLGLCFPPFVTGASAGEFFMFGLGFLGETLFSLVYLLIN
jgi:hypothetical protein